MVRWVEAGLKASKTFASPLESPQEQQRKGPASQAVSSGSANTPPKGESTQITSSTAKCGKSQNKAAAQTAERTPPRPTRDLDSNVALLQTSTQQCLPSFLLRACSQLSVPVPADPQVAAPPSTGTSSPLISLPPSEGIPVQLAQTHANDRALHSGFAKVRLLWSGRTRCAGS